MTYTPVPPPPVSFLADNPSIPSGTCTTLRWSVESVRAVYLDGSGVTGSGSQVVCPVTSQAYTLHIAYEGGSADYQLTVEANPPPNPVIVPTYTPIPQGTGGLILPPLAVPGLPRSEGPDVTVYQVILQDDPADSGSSYVAAASVYPGSVVKMDVHYQIADPTCPTCRGHMLIGVGGDAYQLVGCVYDSVPGPAGITGTGSVVFNAPAERSVYGLDFHYVRGSSCTATSWTYDGSDPTSHFPIGQLYVEYPPNIPTPCPTPVPPGSTSC